MLMSSSVNQSVTSMSPRHSLPSNMSQQVGGALSTELLSHACTHTHIHTNTLTNQKSLWFFHDFAKFQTNTQLNIFSWHKFSLSWITDLFTFCVCVCARAYVCACLWGQDKSPAPSLWPQSFCRVNWRTMKVYLMLLLVLLPLCSGKT